MSKLGTALVLSASLFSSAVSGQDLPPVNSNIQYEPLCTPAGQLVARFSGCAITYRPIITAYVNGEAVPLMAQPVPQCGQAFVLSESGLDKLVERLPGGLEANRSQIEQSRADFRDPTRACPAAAMF